jgi:hypothetical protein
MPHRAYQTVEATSAADLGAQLGRLNGAHLRESIAYVRREPNWNRKLALAEQQIALTQQHLPQYVTELAAYATAAGLSLPDVWVVMCEDELDEVAAEKCTTFVTNGGSLISHNEDWDEDSEEEIGVLRKTIGDLTTLEIHYFNTPLGGSAISINSRGYVQAINSLHHTDGRIGIPRNVIARWLSETGDPEQDFATLCSLPRSAGYNHLLAGTGGRVFNIECTAERQLMWQPELPFAHANHYLSQDLGDFDNADDGDTTFRRHKSACTLVKGRMSFADVTAVNGNTAHGREFSIFNCNTIARVVVDLDKRLAHIWLRREARSGWIAYPLDFIGAR